MGLIYVVLAETSVLLIVGTGEMVAARARYERVQAQSDERSGKRAAL